jgi:hypothetical protein
MDVTTLRPDEEVKRRVLSPAARLVENLQGK